MQQVYNFSPGPAMLPPEVMRGAQAEFLDYGGSGMSVMEISHRSAAFQDIVDRAIAALRQLMGIPESYEVLFMQGGATQQFSMVPMNLLSPGGFAEFVDTGVWSQKAIAEARFWGEARVVASSADAKYAYIPALRPELFDPAADYVHITTNNTIYGTRFAATPDTGSAPLVADMSSNILSQPYEVEKYALIYAGAQKNIAPSGLTVVIIRRDLIGKGYRTLPLVMDYHTYAAHGSLYNTPPTFAIYMALRVFEWTLALGGVPAMEARNREKAALLYDFLDRSALFEANIPPGPDRSWMNVTFHLPSAEADKQFAQAAEAAGLIGLAGHRNAGGMRASLYNPMPLEGVARLVEFMEAYERKS